MIGYNTTRVPRGTQALISLERCPICSCSSQNFHDALAVTDHFLSQEPFMLSDCRACGFRFTHPRPDEESLSTFYQSEEYISHSNTNKGLQARLYQMARRWAVAGKHRLIRKHHPNGRVLDIGCGTGEFLAYLMSRGYQVEGVEPSVHAREAAIAEHGISVMPGIEHLAPGDRFQVITLWHVLEHVPELHDLFKRIHALLAPGGLLVIAVPDRQSWDCGYYGPHWAAWDVPRHLSHFRRADILRLFDEHGFRSMPVDYMWLDAPYIAMLSEKYRGRSTTMSFLRGVLFGAWSNLMALFGKHPTSSSLFLAKKD